MTHSTMELPYGSLSAPIAPNKRTQTHWRVLGAEVEIALDLKPKCSAGGQSDFRAVHLPAIVVPALPVVAPRRTLGRPLARHDKRL